MRVALVHDQLQEFGGAERVLISLHNIFPDSDVYTSFYSPKKLGKHANNFKHWNIITSWADKIPFLRDVYSPFRFLTPLIWEKLDLSSYDLVISSSGSYMSKGVITKPHTLHICYLHHPPRYLYFYKTAREWQKYLPIRAYGYCINHYLRMYDFLSSQRVDYFIANSYETRRRILKFYRRDSVVIYPPVNILKHGKQIKRNMIKREDGDYYLTVSRLEKPKHIDFLIRAANKKKFKLIIVGKGRDELRLKSYAGNTVSFVGNINDEELQKLYLGGRAFLFASEDDEFGIAPVEAMSYGLPVIAFRSGGLIETVKNGKNGILFNHLSEDEIIKSVERYESLKKEEKLKMKSFARLESKKYSEEIFRKNMLDFIENKIQTSSS